MSLYCIETSENSFKTCDDDDDESMFVCDAASSCNYALRLAH